MKQLGRFSVQEELGRGAMGVVYRGVHPSLGVPVAIKVLGEPFCSDEGFRARFRREAAVVAGLDHPGLVSVYDFDVDGDALFIVMEFVEGRSLREVLRSRQVLPPAEAIDILEQLLSAVGAAHARGIVHRDLKPDNVLVSAEGKTKILDFGIARVVDDGQRLTVTGAMVGTPSYMSPEQVKGERVDPRSDLYSLGVMLYELLSGATPFSGGIPHVLHAQVFEQPARPPSIPTDLLDLVMKAMAKDPAERFQSSEELAGALLGWLGTIGVGTAGGNTIYAPAASLRDARATRPRLGQFARMTGFGRKRASERTGSCSFLGCEATHGWRCSYEDPEGAHCPTWWCRKHVRIIEGQPFCSRHATVLEALAVSAGTIREVKHRPLVNDRSLNLVSLIADDADSDLTELLRRRHRGHPNVRVVSDRAVRQLVSSPGQVVWERSWAALQDQGYLDRIALRIPAADPTHVRVFVGPKIVLDQTPEWIAARAERDDPDMASRLRFRNQVLEAVMSAIDSPQRVAVPRSRVAASIWPRLHPDLLETLVIRSLPAARRTSAAEICGRLGLSFAHIEPTLSDLVGAGLLQVHGLASGSGPWDGRPLGERMTYSGTKSGQARLEVRIHPVWDGPAPVGLDEYRATLSQRLWISASKERVASALAELKLSDATLGVISQSMVESRPLLIRGRSDADRRALVEDLAALFDGPVAMPLAVAIGGAVVRVFDPSLHQPEPNQPEDLRWRRVGPPLIQGDASAGSRILLATFDPNYRTFDAPLQLKAAGGLLAVTGLDKSPAAARAILRHLGSTSRNSESTVTLTAGGPPAQVPNTALVVLDSAVEPARFLGEDELSLLGTVIGVADLG
ncbi:MAG: serine/threonine-protein kinase [Candidatus Dormibacteraceae bacterium]